MTIAGKSKEEKMHRNHASAVAAGAARQRGVALLIGMVILVVLALLGASAYSLATQDERIAGNARDRARAAENAEIMLRECEHYINVQAQAGTAVFDGSQAGMLAAPPVGSPWYGEIADWTTLPSTVSFYSLPSAKALPATATKKQPQCIAEEFQLSAADRGISPAGLPVNQHPPPIRVAHVTARGWGLNSNTQVTLVSYVAFY